MLLQRDSSGDHWGHRLTYQPPRPRRLGEIDLLLGSRPFISALGPMAVTPPVFLRTAETWTAVDNGRRLEATIGDVQAGRSLALGDALLIGVAGPGWHEVGWTVFSKSLRRATTGTLVLDLPDDPDHPPFGRLHGILSFPDVPIVDDELDDEDSGDADEEGVFEDKHVARREVRSADPPGPPSSSEAADETREDDGGQPSDRGVNSFMRRLNEAAAWWKWRALGFDPAHDGPDRVKAGPAERVDSDEPAN